jgi:hypothetical protein
LLLQFVLHFPDFAFDPIFGVTHYCLLPRSVETSIGLNLHKPQKL